jgi:hypothetical protein
VTTAPANDNLENAQLIPGAGGVGGTSIFVGYPLDASRQGGERDATQNYTLWYTWTAPGNVLVTLSTLGSNFTGSLVAYQGDSLTRLNEVARHNPSSGRATVVFPAVKGLTYRFAIGTRDNSFAFGQQTSLLNFSTSPLKDFVGNNILFGPPVPESGVPRNDSYSQATRLTGSKIAVVAYPTDASREGAESATLKNHTLWYTWTAGKAGVATLTATGLFGSGNSPVTELAAYDGPSLVSPGNSVQVTASPDGTVDFSTLANHTYHIAIGTETAGVVAPVYFTLIGPGVGGTFPTTATYSEFIGNPIHKGILQVTVSSVGTFSASLTYDFVKTSFTGTLDHEGHYARMIARSNGLSTLSVMLDLDPTGPGDLLQASVADGLNPPDQLTLVASRFTAQQATAIAGRYTALLAPPASASDSTVQPLGIGFATVVVSPKGLATLVFKLADGTALSYGTQVTTANLAGVFAQVYGRGGRFSGTFDFASLNGGTWNWQKPPGLPKQKNYANGFTTTLEAGLSRYDSSPPFLKLNAPVVTFSAGGLATEAINLPPLGTSTTAANGRFKMKITPATGLITGKYQPGGAAKGIDFLGVLFQQTDEAGGFLLNPAVPPQSARFQIDDGTP